MKNLLVMPGRHGWKVSEEGAPHAFAVFPERAQALQTAAKILTGEHGSLTIYGPDRRVALKQFFHPDGRVGPSAEV
jgi:hypothetical protein